jgi:hypothetical protein
MVGTVAPSFEFADFELADRATLLAGWPARRMKSVAVDAVPSRRRYGGGGAPSSGKASTICWVASGRWVLGHVEMDDAATMVKQHDKNEEDAEASGGDREEIERDQLSEMVDEECSPDLRRSRPPLRHQPRDGALGHVNAELAAFAMDARRAPQGIRGGHAKDQRLDLSVNLRATSVRATGELGPIIAEATTRDARTMPKTRGR